MYSVKMCQIISRRVAFIWHHQRLWHPLIKKMHENKMNERWWRKIMKDIILWDISIGNGYCRSCCCLCLCLCHRCHHNSHLHLTHRFRHYCFASFFLLLFLIRFAFVYRVLRRVSFTSISRFDWEWERENVLFGRKDEIVCFFVLWFLCFMSTFA